MDRIRTDSGQRTESRQSKSGQKDIGQSFFTKIRTETRQRTESRQTESAQTDTGHDYPETPDKNETRTGHGQCCPPTSAYTEDMIFIKTVVIPAFEF